MAQPGRKKSTIVRSVDRLVFTSVRAGFRITERLAPGLGAQWAERLWFQLPPAPSGNPPGMPGERFELDATGRRVVGHTWGTGETVYLMHGWGGSAAQLGTLVGPLVAAGFRVVGFDCPSHGESGPGRYGPRSSSIPEFTETLTAVVAAHGPAYAIVAHSLGSPAVATALRDGLTAKRLVFVAPSGDPMPYTHEFARRLGFAERIRRRMVRRIEARVGVPFSFFTVAPVASQVSVPPLLVVHDTDDRETRHAEGAQIAAAWPGSRLVSTSGLGHNRILRDPHVLDAIVEHLAPVRT